MRKVILQEFVSADGFAADAEGKVDYVRLRWPATRAVLLAYRSN